MISPTEPPQTHDKRPQESGAAAIPRRVFSLGALASASAGSAGSRLQTEGEAISAPAYTPGDATFSLQAAIDEAARHKRPLFLPNVVYRIRPGTLKLRSGLTIIGAPGATLQLAGEGPNDSAILFGAHLKDVRLQGITFVSQSDRIWALDFVSCTNVHVVQNVAKSCSLVRFSAGLAPHDFSTGLALSYDRATTADCCNSVKVIGNVADGPSHPQGLGAVCLSYTLGAEVLDNHIRRHGHGIWWWGGDAGKIPGEGSRASPRWVKDVRIEGNDIADIGSKADSSGCGIYGSKGEHVRVIRNTVSHCRDIEIDFEGCVQCEAVDNTVISSASNASLATFFFCSDIRFVGNHVLRIGGGRVFGIFNQPQQFAETGPCVLESNVFESSDKIAVLGANSAVLSFSVRQNQFRNVRIEQSTYSVVEQEYRMNRLDFTITSPDRFDGLYSQAGGSITGHCTKNIVAENIVSSLVLQPPGSRAIVAEDSDYSVDGEVIVSGNKTLGFPIDILYTAAAENNVPKTAAIEKNIIQHSICREEAKASKGRITVLLTGNHREIGSRLLNYPDEIPTVGTWNAGQQVFFNEPEPDGSIGAICTQTGIPGQWRKFKPQPL